MEVSGMRWLGVRTKAFPHLLRLFRDVMSLEITKEAPGVAWFRLADGGEIQIYDGADVDHEFFGAGPVVGFEVDDVPTAVAELAAAGCELIGPGDGDGARRWQHFRGPDGNVYEVIGPA